MDDAGVVVSGGLSYTLVVVVLLQVRCGCCGCCCIGRVELYTGCCCVVADEMRMTRVLLYWEG